MQAAAVVAIARSGSRVGLVIAAVLLAIGLFLSMSAILPLWRKH